MARKLLITSVSGVRVQPAQRRRSYVRSAVLFTLGIQMALGGVLVFYHTFTPSGVRGGLEISLTEGAIDDAGDVISKPPLRATITPHLPIFMEEEAPLLISTPDFPSAPVVSVSPTDSVSDGIVEPFVPKKKSRRNALASHHTTRTAEPALVTKAGVTQSPRYKTTPHPPYPAEAKRMKHTGRVTLLVSVDAQGSPTSVDLLTSSGHSSLDNTAIDWVRRKWKFFPALSNGIPQSAQIRIPINFTLT